MSEKRKPQSPWIPAGATIVAVFLTGFLQYFATDSDLQGRVRAIQASDIATKYVKVLTEKDTLEEVRTMIAITGSPKLVEAFVKVECSKDAEEFRPRFIEALNELRHHSGLPQVEISHLEVLTRIQISGLPAPPSACESLRFP